MGGAWDMQITSNICEIISMGGNVLICDIKELICGHPKAKPILYITSWTCHEVRPTLITRGSLPLSPTLHKYKVATRPSN
jgi:hypothetical protein